ncbi:MAG: ATP-binding cassette domain-containing protein [Gammaproteobacteria bacterium]|nr:ATP-binding cassette domain-containing protein [Gammaproteobacteria bacterium]
MLQLDNLTLRVGGRVLLADLDLAIQPGTRLGIVGANGTGKSSLVRLITGELSADKGELRLPSSWRLSYMAQHTPTGSQSAHDFVLDGHAPFRQAEAELQAAEASGDGHRIAEAHAHYDAIDGYRLPALASELLHGLGFGAEDQGKAVESFSGGWRMRLNLGRALMTPSDLMLLDEPTNHLDLDTLLWLQDWLQRYDGTLILISHDREFLDAVCNHIVHIEHQQARLYRGNYSSFETQRAEVLAQQQAAFRKQQRERAHLQQFVDRFRAKATKAKQAQSRIKALERMALITPAHVDSPFSFHFRASKQLPNPLLQLHHCDAAYGDKTILEDVSIDFAPGDRIGLLGANGAGKSTLIKLMDGQLAPRSGERKAAKDLAIGYFAQHQVEQLDDNASPLLHLQRIDGRADDQSLRSFVGGFGFHGDRALDPVAPFSGGEKARLALALIIYQRPNLLLLDEPTNHLDLDMRHSLTLALQEFEGAIVVVSHDRALLDSVCDRFYLVQDSRVSEYEDDLDSYRRLLQKRFKAENANSRPATSEHDDTSATTRKDRRREQAQRREQLRPLLNQQKKLEQEMARLEQEKAKLERALADSTLYNNEARKAELQELLKQQGLNRQKLEDAETQWLDVSSQLDEG